MRYLFDADLFIDQKALGRLYPRLLDQLGRIRHLTPLDLQALINSIKEDGKKPDAYHLCERLDASDLFVSSLKGSLKEGMIRNPYADIMRKLEEFDLVSTFDRNIVSVFCDVQGIKCGNVHTVTGDKRTAGYWLNLPRSTLLHLDHDVLAAARKAGHSTLYIPEGSNMDALV